MTTCESKKFLKSGQFNSEPYTAPYIVKLIVKVGSIDVMEKNDLKVLIQTLLKKEGLYADHLNDLLSIEKKSEEINCYKIVCDEVIDKNLTFEKLSAIFRTPKHVEGIVDEIIKKANQPEKRDNIAELANEIVKITNSIACQLHAIGKYANALEILFDKTKLANSNLIEKGDINLLCSEYIRARIKNQQGMEEENIETRKKHHEDAAEILCNLIERTNGIEDHNKPHRLLFLAEKVHTHHLLKEYDQAYKACTHLYRDIKNYVLGLPDDLPDELTLKKDEKEYHDITDSKKYQKLLFFSDEAQKYLDIVSIKSRQAYIRSEQERYKEALHDLKEVYSYRKRVNDRYTIQSMRNIAFNCNKLGWVVHKNNENRASQCYHEGLLMNIKAYEMRNEMSFSHIFNSKDIKNIILVLLNIARLNHYYGKEKNEEEYYEKAGGIFQKILENQIAVFGDCNKYTLKAKYNLAHLKNDFGSYYFRSLNIEQANKCHEAALKLFYEVNEGRKINQGAEHEDTLSARKNIAFTHTKLGQVNKSVDHYEKALAIYDILRKKRLEI